MTTMLTEQELTNICVDLYEDGLEPVFKFVNGEYITESTDPDDLEELAELNEMVVH